MFLSKRDLMIPKRDKKLLVIDFHLFKVPRSIFLIKLAIDQLTLDVKANKVSTWKRFLKSIQEEIKIVGPRIRKTLGTKLASARQT